MATFGVIGLGVMGQNLALNIEEHGSQVAVWNLETEWTDKFVAAHPTIQASRTLGEFAALLERPRRILIMIKAGAPVDMTLEKLVPYLDAGDIVIDGGNSWFEDTERREKSCAAKNIHFIGMGVSGGEEGARRGPSLMPGGNPEAWPILKPVLEGIAAKTDSGACVTWVGPGGAGHFVKMVHNGIEYGDMQLIAESYDLLSRGMGMSAGAMAEVYERWNRGHMESFLIELTAKILHKIDPETRKPLVDLVEDAAGQKGTGKWTAQVALDHSVPIPTISAAIEARFLSGLLEERKAASAKLLGPSGKLDNADAVGEALYAAKICSYAQGMALIRAGSEARKWNVDLVEMARIWKGGCIIRARLLDSIMRAFRKNPSLPNLLVDDDFSRDLAGAQNAWRATAARAAESGIPLPAMGASLSYYDGYRSARLPQNLTQAQRDAFGAHTYQRIDRKGFVHTEWLE
jgi:6-phosphogluconate dehydrogenase